MARMKWGSDVNWRELEKAEYEEGFTPYDGPIPRAGMVLSGWIVKMWATQSSAGDDMIKVLFEVDDEDADKKQFNGCPFWDNVTFTMPQTKFRWQPWLDALDITLKDLQTKTVVGEEETNGYRITKIGSVSFAEDFPVRIVTDVEKKGDYRGQQRVGQWLPEGELTDDEEDDAEDDDLDDDPADNYEPDDDEDDDGLGDEGDDDEDLFAEEEEPKRPARRRARR